MSNTKKVGTENKEKLVKVKNSSASGGGNKASVVKLVDTEVDVGGNDSGDDMGGAPFAAKVPSKSSVSSEPDMEGLQELLKNSSLPGLGILWK